jgi:translation elongation factor EF-1alpha
MVAISQLDALPEPFSKRRYDECKAAVARHMKRIGFVPERIACVPVSGLCADNLIEPSSNMPWCVTS